MLTGLSFGLIAAFFWSITNLFDKHLVQRYTKEGKLEGVFLLSCFFPAILLPIAYAVSGTGVFAQQNIPMLLLTGSLMTIWILFYLKALEMEDTSVVMSLLLFAPIFSLIFGNFILHELPSTQQIVGIVVIILGALILTFNQEKFRFNGQLLLLTFCASITMGIMHTLFKFVTIEGDVWSSIFWRSSGMVLIGIAIYICVKEYRDSFKLFFKQNKAVGIGLNSGNEIFTLIGDTFFALALLFAPIAIIQTSDSYQPFFILIITFILSRFSSEFVYEDFSRNKVPKKIIGMVCMCMGSILIIFV